MDARVKKAKYTLNDTGLLGDDVEYSVLVRRARAEITLAREPGLKIPARLQDRAADTECGYRGNRPKPPTGDWRRLCDIHFRCWCSELQKDTGGTFQREQRINEASISDASPQICLSGAGANGNAAISF